MRVVITLLKTVWFAILAFWAIVAVYVGRAVIHDGRDGIGAWLMHVYLLGTPLEQRSSCSDALRNVHAAYQTVVAFLLVTIIVGFLQARLSQPSRKDGRRHS